MRKDLENMPDIEDHVSIRNSYTNVQIRLTLLTSEEAKENLQKLTFVQCHPITEFRQSTVTQVQQDRDPNER